MANYNYRSSNRKYGLTFDTKQLDKILKFAEAAIPNETGGILVGQYSSSLDTAILFNLSGPPVDSKAGRTWFHRGFKGLSSWLKRIWKNNAHYIGEWHFHPFAQPQPSGVDRTQIHDISQQTNYQCKVPVLLILGGDPRQQWLIRVFVLANGELIECFASD